MITAIIGSRNCPKVDIGRYLEVLPDTIISGGAIGVDTCAREYAKKNGLKLIEYYPNYAKYGKAAPLKRNKLIVEECDNLLVFWDGISKGTKHTIEYAKKRNKPYRIIDV